MSVSQLRRPLSTAQVIASLEPAHGGPSYSVPRLCEALGQAGTDAVLFSVAGAGHRLIDCVDRCYRNRSFRWDFAAIPVLRRFRRSSGLTTALRLSVRTVDVVHNHGLWLMPNVESGGIARRAQKPLIVSPRGMLAPAALAFSSRKKRAFWALFQASIVRNAACIHVTSEQEYQEVRAFGLVNPVAVVANGIDIPEAIAKPAETGERTVLSLGRLHPKKGLDRLVRAWAMIEEIYPEWRLRIVGPAEHKHDDALRALATSLGSRRISIEGPIYGDKKVEAYRAADLFVLSSLNENFGLTVAEALAAGTPVISTKGAPWAGLETESCGWWVGHEVDALAGALGKAMALPRHVLKSMGAEGRKWMARDFSWEHVARNMQSLYAWLAHGTAAPSFVHFD